MDHVLTIIEQTKEIMLTIWAHTWMKAIVSSIITITATLLGEENYHLLVILFALIVVDLLTGMIAAVSKGEAIESRKAFKTATKTVVYVLFFSAGHLVTHLVPYSDFIKTGVLSFLALTEMLSVIENMSLMGYVLPKKLLNQIRDDAGVEEKIDHVGNGDN